MLHQPRCIYTSQIPKCLGILLSHGNLERGKSSMQSSSEAKTLAHSLHLLFKLKQNNQQAKSKSGLCFLFLFHAKIKMCLSPVPTHAVCGMNQLKIYFVLHLSRCQYEHTAVFEKESPCSKKGQCRQDNRMGQCSFCMVTLTHNAIYGPKVLSLHILCEAMVQHDCT